MAAGGGRNLSDTIFNEYIQNKTCTFTIKGEKRFINCPCSVVNTFPNMTFVIDRYHFLLKPSELFIKVESGFNCLFLIQKNVLPYEDKNTWFIGNFFLNKFVTVFDYEEKSIHFYTDDIIQKSNSVDYLFQIIIVYSLISILCFGLLLQIIILINKI